MKNFLIGADPEVFLFMKETGEVISAEGYIPGLKEDPFPIDETRGFFVSLDNVLAEYNIPPCKNKNEFYEANQFMLDTIEMMTPESIGVKISSSELLDPKYLQTENALKFGCEPDFNAWTTLERKTECEPGNNLRVAGGHIHIGYENPDEDKSLLIIKALDYYVGREFLAVHDKDFRRRSLYGAAGSCRVKNYGVEWRVPSNFWLGNQALTEGMFDAVSEVLLNFEKINFATIDASHAEVEKILNGESLVTV